MSKLVWFLLSKLVILSVSVLLALLMTTIIIDIAQLFKISSILQLKYEEIFGMILIFRMITLRRLSRKELRDLILNKKKAQPIKTMAYGIMGRLIYAIVLLQGWLYCYLIYWLWIG